MADVTPEGGASPKFPLNAGEVLYIERRRDGFSQPVAAFKAGVSVKKYAKMEKDTGPAYQAIRYAPSKIRPHEWWALYRRRAGMTQTELAAKIGVSKAWVNQLELGNATGDTLETFWNNYYREKARG